MVDARTLHGALSVKMRFNDWVKDRVTSYGFEDGSDFYSISSKTAGRPRQDYLITVDMAKELSMLERSDTGREIRRYYIEMEAAAQKMAAQKMAKGEHKEIPEEFFKASERMTRLRSRIEPYRGSDKGDYLPPLLPFS
jgi:phage anti-repressor protein